MEPAETVIIKLGGAQVIAEALGLSTKQVHCWSYPRERGGTGGIIPSKHQPKLLALAKRLRKKLHPSDLIPAP